MKVQGTITKILDKETGTSKAGKEWYKQLFLLETDAEYNKLYCFEVFGEEKVENLNKFNKVGDVVDVEFNVSTNEWKGKYFTSLQAWKIFKADGVKPEFETMPKEEITDLTEEDNGLPF